MCFQTFASETVAATIHPQERNIVLWNCSDTKRNNFWEVLLSMKSYEIKTLQVGGTFSRFLWSVAPNRIPNLILQRKKGALGMFNLSQKKICGSWKRVTWDHILELQHTTHITDWDKTVFRHPNAESSIFGLHIKRFSQNRSEHMEQVWNLRGPKTKPTPEVKML